MALTTLQFSRFNCLFWSKFTWKLTANGRGSMKRNRIWSPMLFTLGKMEICITGKYTYECYYQQHQGKSPAFGHLALITDGPHVKKTQYMLRATQKCAMREKQGIPCHTVRKWATTVCSPSLKGVGTDCSRDRTESQEQWLKGESEPTKAFNTEQWSHTSGHNT